MTWLRKFLARLFLPCRHVDAAGASITYRERRPLKGVVGNRVVMHLVCDRCGRARPAVDRSEAELVSLAPRVLLAHERMRAFPRLDTLPPAEVFPFRPGATDRLKKAAR